MKTKKPSVALIFGGMGKEHSVSVCGAPYLYSLIDRSRFNVIPILIEEDGTATSASISDSGEITTDGTAAHLFRMFGRGGVIIDGDFTPLAAAIPLLHGDFGEDGTVQGALATVGVPYIGCDGFAGSLCLDKIFSKIVAEHLGLPVAKYRYFTFSEKPADRPSLASDSVKSEIISTLGDIDSHLGYPIIIKPARLGSSVGISVANDREQLISALELAYGEGGGRILCEEFLPVLCEAECACLLFDDERIFTLPGKVKTDSGFYDYEKKYFGIGGTQTTANCEFSDEISSLIREYSERLVRLLGIRHLSRIDFLLTKDRGIIFNEINTFPGFTRDSLYPKLLDAAGISPADAINRLICEVIGL